MSSMIAVIVVVLPWLALPVSSTSPLVAPASSLITSGTLQLGQRPRTLGQNADHGAGVAVEQPTLTR